MKINDNLAVVLKIGDRDAYHTPISKETFEASYRLIAATKAALFDTTDEALILDGPVLSRLVIIDEGSRLARKRGEDGDSGASALIREITRLTMVVGQNLEMLPVEAAGLDEDEWQEALSKLIFFTVNYALAPKSEKPKRAASVSAMMGFSTTSQSSGDWARSLETSTVAAKPAKRAASSVPV